MSLLAELPDVEVAGDEKFLARWPRTSNRAPVALVPMLPHLVQEDVAIGMKLAAVVDDEVVGTVDLDFRRRVRIDDVAHLYTAPESVLSAHLTLARGTRRPTLSLTFHAAGRDARDVLRAAAVLHHAAEGGLALVLPDGTLSADRIPLPAELQIDEPLLDFFQRLAEVGELSGVALRVPDDSDPAILREVLNAHRLLRGESVRGRWKDGQIGFDAVAIDDLMATVEVGARHQFVVDADVVASIGGTQVPLGVIHRQFDDAVVESVDEADGMVILRLRAHAGSSDMVMTPLGPPVADLGARIDLDPVVFDELVSDLDAPPRRSPLRDLI